MIYLVTKGIYPNTAATNRYLAFTKAFNTLSIDHVNVVINPDRNFTCLDTNIYGKTKYLYAHVKCKLFRAIEYHLKYRTRINSLLVRSFCKTLSSNDTVISFSPQYSYYFTKYNINSAQLFQEMTEHPYAYKMFKTQQKYLEFFESCKKLNGIFTISSPIKRFYESIGINSKNINVINMVVDSSRFINISAELNVEPYIAYCGTLLNSKDGVDDLIRSFSIVAKKIPNIKLYIIGKSPSKTESNSNIDLIKEYQLEDRIVLTGMVPAAVMPQLLVNAKVLVLARPNSMQAENGFPTKLGEYLLSKRPVVITKTGDIPLFLKHKEDALLCNPGDVDNIAENILWALENEEKAAVIGRNGCEVALKEFNSINETLKIIRILKD